MIERDDEGAAAERNTALTPDEIANVISLDERRARAPEGFAADTAESEGTAGRDADADLFWPVDENDPAAALLRANNDRERRLWPGDLLPLKRVLQREGFGVWWQNVKTRDRIVVGNRAVTVNEFRDIALRVRKATRLANNREAA